MSSLRKLVEPSPSRRLPVAKRYDAETVAKYIKDLKQLCKWQDEGVGGTTLVQLKQYMYEEYSVDVTMATLARHLKLVRTTGTI